MSARSGGVLSDVQTPNQYLIIARFKKNNAPNSQYGGGGVRIDYCSTYI